MSKREQQPAFDRTLRATAAMGGTLPVAVSAALCMTRFLPLDVDGRFAVGFTLTLPLWVGAMCVTWLARSGARAWFWCASLAVLLSGLGFGVPN